MHSNVTVKNVSWFHFSWATLYTCSLYTATRQDIICQVCDACQKQMHVKTAINMRLKYNYYLLIYCIYCIFSALSCIVHMSQPLKTTRSAMLELHYTHFILDLSYICLKHVLKQTDLPETNLKYTVLDKSQTNPYNRV